MVKEELKTKYGSKTIGELEGIVKGNQQLSREAHAEMYHILYYLETSRRYKENKRYAKEPFKVYVDDVFGIRYNTYLDNRKAYVLFPEESTQFGPGIVSRTIRECGKAKVKEVFQDVNKLEEVKKKVVPRAKIDEIITKNQNPNRVVKEYTDWRAMYETEKLAHDKTKEQLRAAHKKITDLEKQIVKLKSTASMVSRMRKVLSEDPAIMSVN